MIKLYEREKRQMNKAEITKRIVDVGIVPVVRAASAAQAIAAAEAVCAGGIRLSKLR